MLKKILVLLTAIIILLSCAKENSDESEIISKLQILDTFWGVGVYNNFDFKIHHSDSYYVDITAQQMLMPKIEHEMWPFQRMVFFNRNETPFYSSSRPKLDIYHAMWYSFYIFAQNTASCVQSDTIRIQILQVFCNLHSGKLEFPLKTNVLDVFSMSGNSTVTLSGITHRIEINQCGEGHYNLSGVSSDTINAIQNGSGSIYLGQTKVLNLQMLWSGNVYYTGNPEIHFTGTGSGKLIKRN